MQAFIIYLIGINILTFLFFGIGNVPGSPKVGPSHLDAGAGGVGLLCVGTSGSLWRTCSDRVSQRRAAMEVAGLAVWGGAQRRTKLTDEQVPLFLSALASALPLELGTIGPN